MNISTFNLVKCYSDITMGIATGTQTVFGEERIISSAIMKVKPRLFFFFFTQLPHSCLLLCPSPLPLLQVLKPPMSNSDKLLSI